MRWKFCTHTCRKSSTAGTWRSRLRSGRIKEGIKQLSSLLANLFGKSQALGFPQRRPRIFAARTIAFHPLGMAVSTQPLGSHHRKTVEGGAHGFPDTQHPVQGADLA